MITSIDVKQLGPLQGIRIPITDNELKHLAIIGKSGSGKTRLLRGIQFDVQHKLGGSKVKLNFDGDAVTCRDLWAFQGGEDFNRVCTFPFGTKTTSPRVEVFKAILRRLYGDTLLEVEVKQPIYQGFETGLEITANGIVMRFVYNKFPSSYWFIVNMVMELSLHATPAIVLIDNIDALLDIELQKDVMPFLTESFPGTQFIISTHSPFVLSSLSNLVVYSLDHKIRLEDLSAYSYSSIVEKVFEFDQYSDYIKRAVTEYERLLGLQVRSESEKLKFLQLRNKLKKIPSDFAPELVGHLNNLEIQQSGE